EGAPLREAEVFCGELRDRGFHLGALVLNKTLPDYLLSPAAAAAAMTFERESDSIAADLVTTDDELADSARTARVLRTLGDSFRDYEVVARREAELRAELARVPDVVVRVPNFDHDITDVAGLAEVGECLFARQTPARERPVP